ncbi:MAG: penicillin-binding protein activator [Alphaproteobacteria bacterium]|nr:penicillin-binding protein activator [Alphaproteobacteria bacterium]
MLSGCTTASWMNPSSWFSGPQQQADADEAPVPDAAPVQPVQAVAMAQTQNPPQLGQVQPPLQQPIQPRPPAAVAQGKSKVAVLLPLSGKNAALGQAMLNAAQLAVFDMGGGSFEIMPRDTGNDEAGAEKAARDAIASGAQLLIGPLFAAHIPAVKTVAERSGVSLLTLSTDTSQSSPGVFVMGFAPAAQVERVVGFAMTRGAKRFAALVPDNAYGNLVGQAFQLAVARAGGTVMDVQTYDIAKHDSAEEVKELAAQREQIDALFLPLGGTELARVARQLTAAGFDRKRLDVLGTGLWDEPGAGTHDAFLTGGWYAAPDIALRQRFISAYTSTYGQEPPRLATLAYDATALAAVLSRRGARFDRVALTSPNGFAGVDGIFRLTPQGLVERGLAVNEVTASGSRMIEPAPSSFLDTHR